MPVSFRSPQIHSSVAVATIAAFAIALPVQPVAGLPPSSCASVPTAAAVARQTTVRIFLPDDESGSGAIVDRRGDRYTVVTNQHVVGDAESVSLLTPDGDRHLGRILPARNDADVAWVTFASDRSYRVLAIGDSQALAVGDILCAAGFPAWSMQYEGDRITRAESTRDWGYRAFHLTEGTFSRRSDRAFYGGYQLGYTNDIAAGMSGGPLLNANGELVGLNGMLKYPLLGRRAFVFEDGTLPTPNQFLQLEALSWAVPSERLSPPLSNLSISPVPPKPSVF